MLYWKNTVARQQIILIPRCRGYKLCILPVPRILYNRIIVRDYYNRVRFVRSFATHTGSFKISCVSCPTHSFTRFSKHDIVSQVESTLATAYCYESKRFKRESDKTWFSNFISNVTESFCTCRRLIKLFKHLIQMRTLLNILILILLSINEEM